MPYKRPITDFKFNMALLLPPPAPAVDVSPQFPVVGSAMDLIWGGGFATNAEKTNVARARQGVLLFFCYTMFLSLTICRYRGEPGALDSFYMSSSPLTGFTCRA
ncbi:hypothetical protein BDV98DRAFT_568413 [Pterulicium gracile]|uniref:Uncharacterized protein n=1 Tax=Pterulicium gracile TaxID=1884261 RepID=A0A5C3QLJ0_9AGAR|nr:hypothetical protein BDV98DRAFT_568413 [Pterula gracilis]